MYDLLIGVDPGTNCGVATWDVDQQRLTGTKSCGTIMAMDIVSKHYDAGYELKVFIEDARLRKWFGPRQDPAKERLKLQGVGSVKRDCAIWEEFCDYYEIDYELVAPKDNKTKTNAEYFAKLTGWKQRTNEHSRDAAMLVFGRK